LACHEVGQPVEFAGGFGIALLRECDPFRHRLLCRGVPPVPFGIGSGEAAVPLEARRSQRGFLFLLVLGDYVEDGRDPCECVFVAS